MFQRKRSYTKHVGRVGRKMQIAKILANNLDYGYFLTLGEIANKMNMCSSSHLRRILDEMHAERLLIKFVSPHDKYKITQYCDRPTYGLARVEWPELDDAEFTELAIQNPNSEGIPF